MLSDSLVPDEPLIPSSIPLSHGSGPNQYRGPYQPAPSSMMMPSTSRSPSESAGAGSDSSEVADVSFSLASGRFQASEGAVSGVAGCGASECARAVEAATGSHIKAITCQNFHKRID